MLVNLFNTTRKNATGFILQNCFHFSTIEFLFWYLFVFLIGLHCSLMINGPNFTQVHLQSKWWNRISNDLSLSKISSWTTLLSLVNMSIHQWRLFLRIFRKCSQKVQTVSTVRVSYLCNQFPNFWKSVTLWVQCIWFVY